jgi:hypothetical protein
MLFVYRKAFQTDIKIKKFLKRPLKLHKYAELRMNAHCLPDVNHKNLTYFAFFITDDRHI